MNILMSAAGSAAAITIIKHIQSLGHRLIGIDANSNSACLARHYCDEFYLSPLCHSDEFIPFINSLTDKFDLYIPFIDEELRCLSQSTKLLPCIFEKIILNNQEAIKICTNKIFFQQYCLTNNLPIAPLATKAPAIFKPEYGRGSKGIFIIDDDELMPYFEKKSGVIQQLIKGMEYTVDVLTSLEGEYLFAVARKRIETVGVSRIGEVDQNPIVLGLAKICVESLRFNGPINVQIMLTEDNNAYIIEINPRLSGSLMFSTLSGFDIVDLSIKMWTNKHFKIPQSKAISPQKFTRYWQEISC